jgi:hypothetical protein
VVVQIPGSGFKERRRICRSTAKIESLKNSLFHTRHHYRH